MVVLLCCAAEEQSMALETPPVRHTWRNLQAWNFDLLLVWLGFGLIFILAACMNVSSDTWWLLRSGQETVASGRVVTSDSFSWTIRGAYWPNHEWLTQVLFYGLYALGGEALLIGFCAVLVTLTWFGVYRLCEGPPRLRIPVILLGVVSNASGWSVRPQILTMALFVAVLLLLPHARWHWLYIPLFLCWVNLHAGFATGGALLAIAVAVTLVRDRRVGLRLLAIAIISALVTLINPHGIDIWRFTLNSLDRSTYQYIDEWRPHSLADPASYPFFGLIAIFGWSIWRTIRQPRTVQQWVLVIAAGAFMVIGLRSMRQSVFFDLLAVPAITQAFRLRSPLAAVSRFQGALNLAILGIVLLGGAALVNQVWSQRKPVLSPEIIAAVRGCDGPLFNTYDIGGELIWFVPEKPVFIDNRFDPYPIELFIAAALAEESGDYQALFTRYGVRCALVPVGQRIYPALLGDGWSEIVRTETLAVLRR
jgi:hypothetical protein